jgi:molybdopterin synthase catalytic subunit
MPGVHPPSTADATSDWIALTGERLPTDDAVAWATTPECGAVVVFIGVVRDHAEGRDGVTGMTYEAYTGPAERAMRDIADEARRRYDGLGRLVILHRVGELSLGEASVLVVAAAAHRAPAFDAGRYCIDTLKESVPIWKQEHWAGGSSWAVEQHPIRPVRAG